MAIQELKSEELFQRCDVGAFEFESTADLPPLEEIIGQERGMRAIDFGTEIDSFGYNIFVLGPPGAGRTTAVRKALEQRAKDMKVPDDLCYVNNFAEARQPLALSLPAGKGCELRDDMTELVQELSRQLTMAFEGEHYRRQRQQIGQALQEIQQKEFAKLQQKAKERGFALQQSGNLFGIVPVVNDEPLTPEQFEELGAKKKEETEKQGEELRSDMNEVVGRLREKERETKQRLSDLDRKVAVFAVGHLIDDLLQKYGEFDSVIKYLKQVRDDIINNVDDFVEQADEGKALLPIPLPQPPKGSKLDRYKVNLMVNNCERKGAPVIIETNPTYHNLVGRIEHHAQYGALVTDFTMIKSGALHHANGGFLVLEAKDILMNFMAWDALKRCLKNGSIKTEEINEQFRLISTVSVDPQQVPMNIKVVLIGSPWHHYLLHIYDEDFRKLFKVKCDFDDQIDRSEDNILRYALFIGQRCREEKLEHFDKLAVARVVEYGSRLAEDKRKLASTFSGIADIVREASFWAKRDGNGTVTADNVDKAVEEKVYRSNRIEERIREMTEDGSILVDTDGAVVGQANGLAILQIGDYEFGKPSRITARTFAGSSGVVNIEREVKMSGKIHDKGIMILSGYLGGHYAKDIPLSLSATVCFEQSYSEVDGDSASAAELYTLLSSLSDTPLKQGIAVTGSVNQHGQIQPVGGVTPKIEGFFEICKIQGLTGKQGVAIPHQNVRNLNLKQEIVTAVREGKFHIYAVSTIEEGLHLLTGKKIGESKSDGTFPKGTVNRKVSDRLKELAEGWKEFGKETKSSKANKGNKKRKKKKPPSPPKPRK